MTATAAPVITVRNTGVAVRVRWRPVTLATDYRVYVSPSPFATILAASFGATGVAATDIFTLAGHTLSVGDSIVFTSLTGGTGLALATTYYVIAANLTASTFQLSLTKGGAAVDFSVDLSASAWHFVGVPAYLTAAAPVAANVGADGWFQSTVVPLYTQSVIAVTAFNAGVEESARSNDVTLDQSGQSSSRIITHDPFGAYDRRDG